MTHDGQQTMPGVWHKLPTGELKSHLTVQSNFLKTEILTRTDIPVSVSCSVGWTFGVLNGSFSVS